MKRRTPLQLESLEPRLACAGNVTAALSGKTLNITGNAAANFIVVTPTEAGVSVRGLPFAGNFNAAGDPSFSGPATTVNGAAVKTFANVSNISIRLAGGNDAVIVGIDTTEMTLGSLLINTGAGRDYVFSENVKFVGAGSFRVQTHGAAGAAGATEAGDDKVVLADMRGSPNTNFMTSTGGGSDRMEMNFMAFSWCNITLGERLNYIVIGTSSLGNTTLNAGTARDQAFFDNTTMTSLTANLGGGNDLLRLTNKSKVTGLAKLNGGPGATDELVISANSSVPNKQVTGFET